MTISLGDGTVAMAPVQEAKREAKVSNLRERLIAFVVQAAGPLSKNKICKAVSGGKKEKLQLIDALTKEGVFANDGAGWTAAPKALLGPVQVAPAVQFALKANEPNTEPEAAQ